MEAAQYSGVHRIPLSNPVARPRNTFAFKVHSKLTVHLSFEIPFCLAQLHHWIWVLCPSKPRKISKPEFLWVMPLRGFVAEDRSLDIHAELIVMVQWFGEGMNYTHLLILFLFKRQTIASIILKCGNAYSAYAQWRCIGAEKHLPSAAHRYLKELFPLDGRLSLQVDSQSCRMATAFIPYRDFRSNKRKPIHWTKIFLTPITMQVQHQYNNSVGDILISRNLVVSLEKDFLPHCDRHCFELRRRSIYRLLSIIRWINTALLSKPFASLQSPTRKNDLISFEQLWQCDPNRHRCCYSVSTTIQSTACV